MEYWWECEDCYHKQPFREPVLDVRDYRSEHQEEPTACPVCGSYNRYWDQKEIN